MDTEPSSTRLFALTILLTVATVGGFVLSILAVGWWAVIGIVAGLTVGLLQYDALRKSSSAKVFDFPSETDRSFVDFFASWYRQGGSHYIFCRDLDWLSGPEVAVILAALESHRNRVHIFLSDDSASACADLRSRGAMVYRVPNEIVEINVKLSLNVDLETKQIIYRKKTDGVRRNVRFLRTRDANTVALAETLIKACRHISSTNVPHGEMES